MKRLKRILATAISVAMVTGLVAVQTVSAASFSDTSGHWAEATIDSMAAKGIISGMGDGTFKPDNPVTRAQFAKLVNEAFKYTEEADISFSDVNDEWFAPEIAKAVGAGYLQGYEDGTARPNLQIERQQAAVIAANVLGLTGGEDKTFTDMAAVKGYAVDAVKAAAASGIITGYPDGSFKPVASLTRAEAAVIVERMLVKPGSVTVTGTSFANATVEGDLIIINPGTVVENVEVKGDLIIAESVGEGDVTLTNVTVHGDTYVRGGGSESVTAIECEFGTVYVDYEEGNVRLVLEDSAAEYVIFLSGGKLVVGDGSGVETVILDEALKSNAKVVIEGNVKNIIMDSAATLTVYGSVESIEMNAAGTLKLASGSKVDLLHITSDAAGAKVDVDKKATLTKVIIDAKMTFTGAGAAAHAVVNVSGAIAVTLPTSMTGPYKIELSSPGNQSSSGAGDGGGTSDTVSVKAIAIKTPPTKTSYKAGEALDLTGLVVTLTKTNGTTEDVAFSNFSVKNITTSPGNGAVLNASRTSVTITCNGKTASQPITVVSEPSAQEGYSVKIDRTFQVANIVLVVITIDPGYTLSGIPNAFGVNAQPDPNNPNVYICTLKGAEYVAYEDAELKAGVNANVTQDQPEEFDFIASDAKVLYLTFTQTCGAYITLNSALDVNETTVTCNSTDLNYSAKYGYFTGTIPGVTESGGDATVVITYQGVEKSYTLTITEL